MSNKLMIQNKNISAVQLLKHITHCQGSPKLNHGQQETAYVRQGERGLDPDSVSGYGLRIQITSKM